MKENYGNKTWIDRLFRPRNIAVIGASTDQSTLATVIFKNIIYGGFKGNIFPVNPKYSTVLGYKCFADISEIPTKIDLAIVVIPSKFVPDVVKRAADAGVVNLVIISAGFKETGKQGEIIEREMVEYANSKGTRILGPNCLGISISKARVDASFASQPVLPGNIAFMSQSGAFNCALLDMAKEVELGFSHLVSFGNKSDINENELLEYWLNDENVKVIGGYLEQFKDGKEFIEIIKRNPHKPIVILHPGKTKESRKAAVSHTGSMADSSKIVQTALKQYGVIQVETVEEMFNTLMILSWSDLDRLNQADDIALVTNAGGPGIMLTDLVVEAGLKIAKLKQNTKEDLRKVLPHAASVNNPVDLIGDALADRYENSIQILSEENNSVETIVALLTPQRVTEIEKTAISIISLNKSSSKFIVPIFMGGELVQKGLQKLWAKKVAAFDSSVEAINALRNLNSYLSAKKQLAASKVTSIDLKNNSIKFGRKIFTDQKKAFLKEHFGLEFEKLLSSKPKALPELLSKSFIAQFGFDLPYEAVIDKVEEAKLFAKKVGYPVVIKATTEDVAHKTEFKALYLGLKDETELEKAFKALQKSLKAHTGKSEVKVLIQEQIIGGEEILIGISRDGNLSKSDDDLSIKIKNGFGHVLLFGKGGIYTEIYGDTSTRLLPANRRDLNEMISETKVSKILNGARGKGPLNTDKLVESLELIQEMVALFPEIESIDINPVILTQTRCICVDFKIFISK